MIRVSLQPDFYGWVASIVGGRDGRVVEVFSPEPDDAMRLALETWRGARAATREARKLALKKLN